MKRQPSWLLWSRAVIIVLLVWAISACDLLDPTSVENPQTTDESLKENATGAAAPFLNGLHFRYSDAVEDLIIFTDVVSDNYDNVSTFTSPLIDNPRAIMASDLTLNHETSGLYFEIQELRALADFAINSVIPNDANATDEQRAEALFYRGMANLLSAENFAAVPVEENGAAVPAEALIGLAIDDFKKALTVSGHAGFEPRIHLVLARAYRIAGNKEQALSEADMALSSTSEDFVFSATYDAANNINNAYNFTVGRSNSDDYQPLPRLDFLDPKYLNPDAPVPFIKMEEAYLIKAEIALSDGDAPGAAQLLAQAIELAESRPTVDFIDPDARRDTEDNALRPDSGLVKASPDAEAIDGLILPRSGNMVSVPVVSGTSLDADQITSMSDPEAVLYHLYLARQEIFFYEGRRMSDLGIRLPMMNREIETNANIQTGATGTEVMVPDYIPAGNEMDAYESNGDITTILHDMNRVLAENRVSPFTMPF